MFVSIVSQDVACLSACFNCPQETNEQLTLSTHPLIDSLMTQTCHTDDVFFFHSIVLPFYISILSSSYFSVCISVCLSVSVCICICSSALTNDSDYHCSSEPRHNSLSSFSVFNTPSTNIWWQVRGVPGVDICTYMLHNIWWRVHGEPAIICTLICLTYTHMVASTWSHIQLLEYLIPAAARICISSMNIVYGLKCLS